MYRGLENKLKVNFTQFKRGQDKIQLGTEFF